jgi:dTDP-4-dehydrorhamnose reductase
MKVLVTGANGLLGQHLIKQLLNENFKVLATAKGPGRLPFTNDDSYRYFDVDITDAFRLNLLMKSEMPEVVVHAAAMTQVDQCELNQEECSKVNVEGTANVVIEAEQYSRFLIYISTDFVFDGEKGNYNEEDDLNPINWYGFTKMEAESIVETSEMPWSIVRTCLVYGNVLQGTRTNIISWVRESLEAGKDIKVVSDQVRTPTYVADLARGIVLIIKKNATGVFHIAGKDIMTPYDIAVKTAELFGLDKTKMTKADQTSFSQPGRRPLKTGFDISKARRELKYEPLSFDEAIREMYRPEKMG